MGSQISTATAINSAIERADSRDSSSRIVHAIQSAASKTGVNFSYLMQKASQESSFDPTAKSSSSSATGLFQFTSHTWLHMIKTYGDQYGLGSYAAQIQDDGDGKLTVSSAAAKQAILALRKDPVVSAEMAGELDKENAAILEQKVGGKIGATELYLAHFLGASGASRFIKEMRSNPKATAANVMPSAAASNPGVFYSKSGDARSLQQIYRHFAQKFDDTGSTHLASATAKTSAAVSANFELSDLSTSRISANFANLMPTETAASRNSADETLGFREKTRGWAAKVASASGSTLVDAMIFGQVQGAGLTSTSPVSAYTQQSDNKKKNTYSVVSALG